MPRRIDRQQARDGHLLGLQKAVRQSEKGPPGNFEGPYVLGDATRLVGRARGAGDAVQERGLPVVDVTQQRHDGLSELGHGALDD